MNEKIFNTQISNIDFKLKKYFWHDLAILFLLY